MSTGRETSKPVGERHLLDRLQSAAFEAERRLELHEIDQILGIPEHQDGA